jgi:hypothetical protein
MCSITLLATHGPPAHVLDCETSPSVLNAIYSSKTQPHRPLAVYIDTLCQLRGVQICSDVLKNDILHCRLQSPIPALQA